MSITHYVSGILHRLEIVEGKDTPRQSKPKEFSDHGKTVGPCLCLAKSIYGTGNVVVMDRLIGESRSFQFSHDQET